MNFRSDVLPALAGVWLVISLVLLLAALTPFLAPSDALFGVFPVCEARARGSSCALCGMTTAYVHIGRGDFGSAQATNHAAVPLWVLSLLNFPAAAAYSIPALLRARRNGELLTQ